MRDPFGMRSRILSEPSETTASLVLPPYTKEYIMPLDQDIKAEIINDFQKGNQLVPLFLCPAEGSVSHADIFAS